MNKDVIRKIYDAMSKEYDMAEDFNTFSQDIQNKDVARRVYDAMYERYRMEEDFDEFYKDLSSTPTVDGVKATESVSPAEAKENTDSINQFLENRDTLYTGLQDYDTGIVSGAEQRRREAAAAEAEVAAAAMRKKLHDDGTIKRMESAKKEARQNKRKGFWDMFGSAPSQTSFLTSPEDRQRLAQISEENAQKSIAEYSQNKLLQEKLDVALDMARAGENQDGLRGVENFGLGLWDSATRLSTWDFGYSDIVNNLTLQQIVEKWENDPSSLTATEQKVLDGIGMATAVQELYADQVGIGYNVGQSLPESAGFMASMALNPASGLGESLARNAVRTYGRNSIAKNLARIGGDIAETAIMTATTGAGRVAADALERINGSSTYEIGENGVIMYGGQKDQETVGNAVIKAIGSNFIENYSEALGEYFDPLLGMSRKVAAGSLRKMNLNKWADALSDLQPSQMTASIRSLREKTKFGGIFGEVMEEEIGMALNTLFVGDNQWSDFVDLETQLTTVLSCAIMSGTLNGVEQVSNVAARRRMEKNTKDAEQSAANAFGEQFAELRESIDQASPEGMVDVLRDVYMDQGYSLEQKRKLAEYAAARLQMQYYNAADANARREVNKTQQGVLDAYEAGRHAQLPAYYNIEQEYRNSEEAINASENAENIWAAIETLNRAPLEEHDMIINDFTEEEQQLIRQYRYNAARVLGAVNSRAEQAEDLIDEYRGQITPFIMPDGKVTTAILGDNVVFVMEQNENGDAVVHTNDGRKIFAKTRDLEHVEIHNAEALIERFRQSTNEAMDIETENAFEHHPKTQAPQVGLQLQSPEGEVVITAVNDNMVEIVPAVYKDGQVQPKEGAEPQTITVDDAYAWQDSYYQGLDDAAAATVSQPTVDNMSAETAENESTPTEEIEQSVSEEVADGQNAETQPTETESIAPSAPQTARERVPKDDKGNPIYEQTDADTAWDAIVEETEGDTEMAQRVAADMLEDKKAALAKLQNGKPKKGATVAEKIANEKAHAAAIAQAQNDVAQWEAIVGTEARRRAAAMSEADRYVAEMEQKNINEGLAALGEPQSLEEYVLGQLAGGSYKLRWSDKENGTKGFGSHTGLSTEEMKARLSMIDNKDGLTPEEIAHSIVENMDASFGEVDVMDVTNMVIDSVSTHESRRSMLNGMVESRAELMRQQEIAEQEAKDAWYMEQYHATEEELAAYNEYLAEFAEEIYGEDTDYEQRIATFAEIQLEYDNQGTDAGLRSSADQGEGLASDREGSSSVGEEEQLDRRELREDAEGVAEAEDGRTGSSVSAQSDDRQSRINRAIAYYRENVDDSPEAIAAAERDQHRYEADIAEDARINENQDDTTRRSIQESPAEAGRVSGEIFDGESLGEGKSVSARGDGGILEEGAGKKKRTAKARRQSDNRQEARDGKAERLSRGISPVQQQAIDEYTRTNPWDANLTDDERGVLSMYRMATLNELDDLAHKLADKINSGKATPRDRMRYDVLAAYAKSGELKAVADAMGVEYDSPVSLDTIKSLFETFNSDPELAELFNRVFPLIKEINPTIVYRRFTEKDLDEGEDISPDDILGQYSLQENLIEYNRNQIDSNHCTEQEKASTIVHEMIHAVARYAIRVREARNEGVELGIQLPKRLLDAAQSLIEVYDAIKDNEIFNDDRYESGKMYGVSSVHEMLSELANPEFREKLKQVSIENLPSDKKGRVRDALRAIKDFLHRMFGWDSSSAYARTKRALDKLIDNYDSAGYNNARELADEDFAQLVAPSDNLRFRDGNNAELKEKYTDEQIFDAAKQKFGVTDDIREAGYILPDGSMLDFSGRYAVDGDASHLKGERHMDHREVNEIAYDDNGNETGLKTNMTDFIERGAIRIHYSTGGVGIINLDNAPTKEQKAKLRQLISAHNGNMDVDFGNGWNTDYHAEYDKAKPTRILGDIDRYYSEGVRPEGNILYRDGAPFFSNAERAVENIKQNKATPEQWLAMIKKDGGLKAGEDKWMGLSDWLNEQKTQGVKTLAKEEVLQFIRENQIEIEEVEYGDNPIGFDELKEEYEAMLRDEGYDAAHEAMVDRFGDDFDIAFNDLGGELVIANEEAAATLLGSGNIINSTRLDYTTAGLENKREIALVVPTIEPWNQGDEIHFGDAGDGRAVAWVRFGETTDEDGNRVLVIDEVQSKRHDEGRAKGYSKHTKREEFRRLVDEMYDKYGANFHVKMTKDEEIEFDRLTNERIREDENNNSAVPDAPFDKNYHELVMKRMLRYAAENGFDKAAWTKGAQQAQRYGLSNTVSSIEYKPLSNGHYSVMAYGTNGYPIGNIPSVYNSEQEIADVFGKEMAVKIVQGVERARQSIAEYKESKEAVRAKMREVDEDSAEYEELLEEFASYDKAISEARNAQTIEGEDLQIGGDGMKGYYDEMIPRFMNKYTKKWGTKVGEVTLPNVEEAGRTMWSVDVTPEMRKSVMQGQPMFREVSYENDPVAKFMGKPRYYGKRATAFAERERRRMENAAKEAAEMLGIEAEIVTDASMLQGRKAKAKGWYDIVNKKVVVVVPNHVSMGDAVRTVLHEGIAHHGLRELFGDGFDAMLDNVYNNVSPELKARIDAIAERTGVSTSVATEEYMASLAETTNFEEAQRRGWWQQIKSYFVDMLRKLSMPGLRLKEEITDNELRYLLWRSYKNLVEPNSYLKPLGYAEDVVKQKELKVGEYEEKAPATPMAADAGEAEGWAAVTMQRIEELEAQAAQLENEIAEMEADRDADDASRYEMWEQQLEPLRKQMEDVYAELEGLYSLEAEAEEMSMASEEGLRYRSKGSARRQERNRINNNYENAVSLLFGIDKKKVREERIAREKKRREDAKEIYDSVLSGDFNDVTLQKINDYIDDATPQNPFGRRISQRLPQKLERGLHEGARTNAVDALFSRISESAVPANERVSEAGRRKAEERKKELLKGWAIATGNWHTDLSAFVDDTTPIGEGTDSKVYLAKDGAHVIKASKGKPYGKRFRPDMDNIALFNRVFYNSRYEIVGYGEIDGEFVRILKQPIVDFTGTTPLTPDERVEYMKGLKFEPINDSKTAFSNGEIVISDLQKSNIIKDAAGNVRVIDADAKLHTKDVGGNYTYPPVEADLPQNEDSQENNRLRYREGDDTKLMDALADAYASGDAAAIQGAVNDIMNAIRLDDADPSIGNLDWEKVENYNGTDPRLLAAQYIVRAQHHLYLDEDYDTEYIKTGIKTVDAPVNETAEEDVSSYTNDLKNEQKEAQRQFEERVERSQNNSAKGVWLWNGLMSVEEIQERHQSLIDEFENLLSTHQFDKAADKLGEIRAWQNAAKRHIDNPYSETPYVGEDVLIAEIERESAALGVPVRIARSVDELPDDTETRKRAEDGSLKGVYSTRDGEVVVYLPNTENANDAKRTILHEIVGHKGLRSLIGEQQYDKAMLQLMYMLPADVRDAVLRRAERHGWNAAIAMDEYLAEQAERDVQPTWWGKVNAKIRALLRNLGFDVKLTDADVTYLLWRSRKKLQGDDLNDMAVNAILKQAARKSAEADAWNEQAFKDAEMRDFERNTLPSVRHRMGADTNDYEKAVRTLGFKQAEAWQDSMRSLLVFQQALAKASGKDISDFENAYMYENRMSSANLMEMEQYRHMVYTPLLKEIHELEQMGASRESIINYLFAKSGLERNEVLARRDAKKNAEGDATKEQQLYDKYRQKDYAGLTALTRGDAQIAALVDDHSKKKTEYDRLEQNKKRGVAISDADLSTAKKEMNDARKSMITAIEAEAQRMVDKFEAQHNTDDLWDKIRNCTHTTLNISHDAGIMSDEVYNELWNQFQYYVPLRGFAETTAEDMYLYLGGNDSPYNAPIKTAYGRTSLADDPIATIGNMAESAIVEANRNRLKQRFLYMVERHNTDLASISDVWLEYDDVNDEWHTVFAQIPDDATPSEAKRLQQEFEDRMKQLAEQNPGKYANASQQPNIPYRVVKKGDRQEHHVIVKRNGKDVVITINGNPRVAQAINGLTNPEQNNGPVQRIVNWVNRNLSANFTMRNPAFMVSNFVRDGFYTNSMVWVKENPAYALQYNKNWAICTAQIASLVKRYKRYEKGDTSALDMNNDMDRMFYEFMINGGETGYTVIKSVEDYKGLISGEMKKMEAGAMGTARRVADTIGSAVDTFGRWAEDTSRFAAYMTSRQLGRTITKSIWDAKEISVNFNKKGSGNRMMGKFEQGNRWNYVLSNMSQLGRNLYVFWNAGIQGLNNFSKAAKKSPAKFTAMAGAYFTLGVIVAAAFSGDDDEDDYYNLPEYVRRNNICFKIGKGKYATLPLPIEIRAIYGLGELAYSYLSGREGLTHGEAVTKTIQQITQVLPIDMMADGGGAMALVPSAAKPVVEVVFNVDWTGRPIYKEKTPWNQNDPTWTLAFKSTSPELVQMSRLVNEWTNKNTADGLERPYNRGWADNRYLNNPAVWEHILEGYLGGMATMFNQTKKTLMMPFNEDLREVRNVPIASRFIKDAGKEGRSYAARNEYYDAKNIVDSWKNEMSKAKKEVLDESLTDEQRLKAAKLRSSLEQQYMEAAERWKVLDRQRKALEEAYKSDQSEDNRQALDDVMMQMATLVEAYRD